MYLTARMGPNGFGNEFVKVAKLLVCRKALGIPIAGVYWRSPYRAAIPRSLCYASRVLRAVRRAGDRLYFKQIEFGRAEHLATGRLPVEEALACFLKNQGLLPQDRALLEFTGFDPGIETIENHGSFLCEELRSVPATGEMLQARIRTFAPGMLHVGVHIRRGDFRPALPLGTPWPGDKWNIQVPLEWYEQACAQMAAAFPGRVQFVVATNGQDPEVETFCRKREMLLLRSLEHRASPDVADMLALAACDLLVSSPSWFSGWAAILNPKPWLWYAGAHGEPPWGRKTAVVFHGDSRLPEAFLNAAEQVLRKRQEGRP